MFRPKFDIPLVFSAALLFCLFMMLAAMEYEFRFSFIFTNISRLGRPNWNPDGATLWMVGIVITSVGLLPYYWGLDKWKTGQGRLDLAVEAVRALALLSTVGLLCLGIWNADHTIPHKVFGGMYFITDALLMLVACYVAWKHPKIDDWLMLVCLGSFAMDILFLRSHGQLSWAEWWSVGLSFLAAIWLAMNSRRLETSAVNMS